MENERRKPHRFGLFLAIIFGSLLLYALSSGPAAWLATRGYISPEWYEMTFAPLYAIAQKNQPCRDALYWYEQLWLPTDLYFQ